MPMSPATRAVLEKIEGLFKKGWDQPKPLTALGHTHKFRVQPSMKGGHVALVPHHIYKAIKVQLGRHGAVDMGTAMKVRTPGVVMEKTVSHEVAQKAVAAYANQIKGGKGDKLCPTKFPIETIAFGMGVEAEHTPDSAKQLEIVMDHLAEKPDYYERLDDAGLADSVVASPTTKVLEGFDPARRV